MYDDMNDVNLHIVYSPIFGEVPLCPNFVADLANALGIGPNPAPDVLANALAIPLANAPPNNNVPIGNGFVV